MSRLREKKKERKRKESARLKESKILQEQGFSTGRYASKRGSRLDVHTSLMLTSNWF